MIGFVTNTTHSPITPWSGSRITSIVSDKAAAGV
jgi:hypothetical protein